MSTRRYEVRLSHEVSRSFRCQLAANSVDLDTERKAVHELTVDADVTAPFNVGLILGASGSGKTTLARQIWGEEAMRPVLDLSRPVIEQFPEAWSYDECAEALIGVGLTSVPCWIRPAHTLSNGQQVRADASLRMARLGRDSATAVIDEWTSVVDRTVAKVMSHCVQKYARRVNARLVLVSCHYDVVEWLNPDWIIDCNKQSYSDRRSLWRSFRRTDSIAFTVHQVERSTWRPFAKYHYLSPILPGGTTFCYGLFHGDDQIGFTAWSNYVPRTKGKPLIVHGNRTVIHPDYVGLGLGMKFVNAAARHLYATQNVEILSRFSSVPMYRAMLRDPDRRFLGTSQPVGKRAVEKKKDVLWQRGRDSVRRNVTMFLFRYEPRDDPRKDRQQ